MDSNTSSAVERLYDEDLLLAGGRAHQHWRPYDGVGTKNPLRLTSDDTQRLLGKINLFTPGRVGLGYFIKCHVLNWHWLSSFSSSLPVDSIPRTYNQQSNILP